MKKAILSIFICLSAILLMSHNVGAIDLTQDVYLIQGNFQFEIAPWAWTCYNDTTCPSWSTGTYQRSFASFGANITDISVSIPNRTYVEDDWIVFDFYFFHSNTAANHSIFDGIKYGGGNPVDVVDVQFEQLTDNSAHATVYLRAWGSFTDSNLRLVGNATLFQLQSAATAQYKAQVDAGIMTIWHSRSGTNYSQTLNTIDNSINSINNNIDDLNDNINNLNDTIEDRNEQEDEALDNISNQTPADISEDGETENQATTNLIGLFSSFISALSNITQAQNCNLTLNFPSYAGGTLNVNVCQYKDKAGNLISVFSSLTLIVFYIPLALKLLSMIYNEIRSFTNG